MTTGPRHSIDAAAGVDSWPLTASVGIMVVFSRLAEDLRVEIGRPDATVTNPGVSCDKSTILLYLYEEINNRK